MVYTPFLLVETTHGPGQFSEAVYTSPLLEGVDRPALAAGLNDCPWGATVTAPDAQAIASYFNAEVARMSGEAQGPHASRVAAMTSRLFNLSSTAAPGF